MAGEYTLRVGRNNLPTTPRDYALVVSGVRDAY